jgi:hypothetical protein
MADNLKETRDIVAELEELLEKSKDHASKLPEFMRKVLGVTDRIKVLEEQKSKAQEEGADAIDDQDDASRRAAAGQNAAEAAIMGQLGFAIGLYNQLKGVLTTVKAMVMGLNPLTLIFAALAIVAGDFLRTWSKVREEIGGAVGQSAELAFEIQKAQRSSFLLQLDGEKVRASAKAIADEYGTINQVTRQSIKNVAEFSKLNGASVEDVAKLARLFDVLELSSDQVQSNMKAAAIEAGVLVNVAFKEVANNAEFFARYTDEGAQNIQEAVVFAKQLGVTLDTTAKMADKLLDVESAITGQYKLSSILGKQINMEEAIRLNFLGQTDEAQKLIVSLIRSSVNEMGGFNKLLPIQRRELAQTFGITEPELLKIISADLGGAGAGAVGRRASQALTVPTGEVLQVNQKPVVDELQAGFKQLNETLISTSSDLERTVKGGRPR